VETKITAAEPDEATKGFGLDPAEVRNRQARLQKLVTTAISIASQAVVEHDPVKLAKIAVASSLLALASNVSNAQSDRLFRVARSLTSSGSK